MSSWWGPQKLLQGLVSHELTAYLSVFDLLLTQWIIAMLSKGCKPESFESRNSLKRSFMNICGLQLNFAEYESFLESNSPDILPLWETNLDDSIDTGNFSVMGYLPLTRKDCITHMHGLAVYVKDFFLYRTYLWKTLQILTYAFNCLFLSDFFFLFRWTSSSLCTVFDSII